MRTKEEIIGDVKAVVQEISSLADEMGDCGGLQGAAVMSTHPEFVKRLQALEEEAKAAGLTEADFKP
jgi:hypothetical protein